MRDRMCALHSEGFYHSHMGGASLCKKPLDVDVVNAVESHDASSGCMVCSRGHASIACDICLSQIEDASALYEFDSISEEADGLVLSRGNLGLDIAPEKMARVQKAFIAACNLLVLPPPPPPPSPRARRPAHSTQKQHLPW